MLNPGWCNKKSNGIIYLFLSAGSRFALRVNDTHEVRSEKTAIFLLSSACSAAGVLWSISYFAVHGWTLVTVLPLLFSAVVGTTIGITHLAKSHRLLINVQIASVILIPAAIQWSMGGVFDSGVVLIWASLGPISALMFTSRKASILWFALFLLMVAITVVFNEDLSSRALETTQTIRISFLVANICVSSLIVFLFTGYWVRAAIYERLRANRLLLNVLPLEIAEALKASDQTIAEGFDSVSVLFADVVGSTPLFSDLSPYEVVDWLNEVFSVLDEVVERHGLEKIRTMGDGYMVGSGLPQRRSDHATELVSCAIEMIEKLEAIPSRFGSQMKFRFGINSGPVVAGVIGKSKFHYDLWGDTVNVASRMESTGKVDQIHISDSTQLLVKDTFHCTSQGEQEIKGKGTMRTWFVDLPSSASSA
jgi:adenylate cyclase